MTTLRDVFLPHQGGRFESKEEVNMTETSHHETTKTAYFSKVGKIQE